MSSSLSPSHVKPQQAQGPEKTMYQDRDIQQDGPFFLSAKQAFIWATETMRRMRFPSASNFYREIMNEAYQEALKKGTLQQIALLNPLPESKDDRALLAYDVYRLALENMPKRDLTLLRQKYWGDYVTLQHYEKARQHQEKARKDGLRVRLKFSRNLSDLAAQEKVAPSTIKRRHDKALENLGRALEECQLMA